MLTMEKEKQVTFIAPKAELGQVVYWYPHGLKSQSPHPAVVSKCGHDSLCLSVFHPGSHNLFVKDGVRHLEDPRARQPELIEQGAWDHTPQTKRLLALESLVEDLFTRVTSDGK